MSRSLTDRRGGAPRHVGGASIASRPQPVTGDRTPIAPPPGTLVEDPCSATSATTSFVAYSALFAFALEYHLPAELTTGLLVALVLLPVSVSSLGRFPLSRALVAGAMAVFAAGVWLAGASAVDHSIAPRGTYSGALQLTAAFGGLGLILWTRRVLPTNRVGLALGLGLLANNALSFQGDPTGNPWKFHFSAPVTIVVLAVLASRNRTTAIVGALGALSVLAALNDSRSYIGFAALAAGLTLWQRLPRAEGRPRPLAVLLLLAVLVVAGFNLATEAIVHGLLGTTVQQRSEQQIQASGSLLAGGRPEWSATLALMRDRPSGYGLGVVPNTHDITVGRDGLEPLHIPTIRGYAINYMFGGQFKLHSVIADFWAMAGPVGLAFGGLLFATILYYLVASVAYRRASALVVFVSARGLWFLAFGPIGTNLEDVIMAAALVLPARGSWRAGSAAGPTSASAPVPLVSAVTRA